MAIDGPAGAGKSTVARQVAERLGFLYIDSGAMYRAITLWAMRVPVSFDDDHRLEQLALAAEIKLDVKQVFLNGEDVSTAIRMPEVSANAARVATVAGVRRALVAKQREYAAERSVVMEGRDIGSVVFPDAQVKVFLDADKDVRAARRVGDIGGEKSQVRRDLLERDTRDRQRVEAPLLQAPDAVYIDSTHLNAEGAVEAVLKLVRERTSNGKEAHS